MHDMQEGEDPLFISFDFIHHNGEIAVMMNLAAISQPITFCRSIEAEMARFDPFNDDYPWSREDDVITECWLGDVVRELADREFRTRPVVPCYHPVTGRLVGYQQLSGSEEP